MSQQHYDELVRLARKAGFPCEDFTEAEEKFLESLANGQWVDCLGFPKDQRVIRADFFEWLMTDREGSKLHHHRGVAMRKAIFPNGFDLSHAKIHVPLTLFECRFDSGVELAAAELHSLVLSRSKINKGSRRLAIAADGIEVKGDVFFQDGFEADGAVRLLGASIGGLLSMSGAKLRNKSGYALNADGIEVGGGVFMKKRFAAIGEISFVSGRLGSYVFITNASVRGTLDLRQATIERSLHLEGGSFRPIQEPSKLSALRKVVRLDGITVRGDLRLADSDASATIKGVVNLRGAKVGVLHDSDDVWSREAIPALDGFVYDTIGRDAPKDASSRRKWLELGRHAGRGFAPQPYTQLAKVLRESGHPGEAKQILAARERRQVMDDDNQVRIVFRRLFGLLLGYGYYPERAALPLVAVFLIGLYVFNRGWKDGHFNPVAPRVYLAQVSREVDGDSRRFPPDPRFGYRDLTLESEDPNKRGALPEYPVFQSFVYSLDTLLPIVNLHQEDYWIPTGNYRLYLWFHIALGWIFTTLLVAGFAGVVRRPVE